MESDLDALDEILNSADNLADAIESSNSKPESESNGGNSELAATFVKLSETPEENIEKDVLPAQAVEKDLTIENDPEIREIVTRNGVVVAGSKDDKEEEDESKTLEKSQDDAAAVKDEDKPPSEDGKDHKVVEEVKDDPPESKGETAVEEDKDEPAEKVQENITENAPAECLQKDMSKITDELMDEVSAPEEKKEETETPTSDKAAPKLETVSSDKIVKETEEKTEPSSEIKSELQPEIRTEAQPEIKQERKLQPLAEIESKLQPEIKTESQTDIKIESKESTLEPACDTTKPSESKEFVVEADLTEVPMEIEPDFITAKPPTPKPESIVALINASSDDVELVPLEKPQSPRIIELLDDDDDEVMPPVSKKPTLDLKSPLEVAKEEDTAMEVDEEMPQKTEQIDDLNGDEENLDDFYFEKDCVNYECQRQCKRFVKAPLFILNFYKIPRKSNKTQFVCDDCYDRAVEKYEDLAASLQAQLPLLEQDIPKRQDFVEILDSSDEDDDVDVSKSKDEPEFEKDTVAMLEKELDDTICDILSRVEIKSQVNWSKSILKNKLKKLEADSLEITNSLKKLQKSADKMHTSLYQCPKIKIKELQSLDLNTGRPFVAENESTMPPLGELKFAPIVVGAVYYAVRNKAIASWLPCRVIELMDVVISGQKAVKYYKVKYSRIKIPTIKCVSAKHMAYGDPPNVRLSIGARVIALFDGSTLSRSKESIARSAFYPGIVAEQLQAYNKYRYLIFFDDGYAQYVYHNDVRVVCQAADNVWEDVHPGSREFIHNYLSQYQKHRPMVQVKKGQSMITESNGKWLYAKVIDIDASLVQMHFDGQNRSEWIYRGSTRLGPLFREKQTNRNVPVSQLARRSEPYVRYMQDEDTANKTDNTSASAASAADKQSGRAVAKKSTARQDSAASSSVPVKHLNNSTIFLEDDNRPKGKVVYYTAKKNMPPKLFVTHECDPNCLFSITHNLSSYSPLAKPLLSGWERQIFKSKLKKSVVYRAPCGRRIRNMEELHKYLRLTRNALNVDNFDFDCVIHCLAEYVIESSIVQMPDLSVGLENMVIPCINYYDNTMPPECVYSAERIPTDGVNLNLDPSFLCGCDCEDDCADKSKCSCWQLTLSGARFGNPNTPPENVGYSYKRLPDPVPTGIYECNSNCKCSSSCLNRVVQHPLQMKLQVFKTSNRGWGLRCLNDVPKGSFICIYAGHLLTEQKANEGGANAGDEYFAELDYIEVVERLKEGYESDVQEENETEDEEYEEPNPDADSDEDFRTSAAVNKNASINTRLRSRKGTRDFSEDEKGGKGENAEEEEDSDKHDQERQVISFVPNTSLGNEESTTVTKYRSIRKYFGKNEYCYIMDAKTTGNIGRYFNHSCSPNLFVQNVFVDTQDLRFPWVAFFALSHIRAGTELTWNYNYEVGIVPGKVLYCECGAPNCRGRLL